MKSAILTLLIASIACPAFGSSTGRPLGFSVGGGVSRDWLTLTNGSSRSRFDGWGPSIELGLDVPCSNTFGLLLGAIYQKTMLNNSRDSDTSLENGTRSSFEGRAGFFWGNFAAGYGLGSESLRIRQMSVNGISSDSSLNGAIKTVFASYNLQFKTSARLGFEASYRSADLGSNTNETTLSGMMKFMLLIGGD